MIAAILAGSRKVLPFGLFGGKPGLAGKTTIITKKGKRKILNSTDQLAMEPGDVILIETPGGGGFGEKNLNTLSFRCSGVSSKFIDIFFECEIDHNQINKNNTVAVKKEFWRLLYPANKPINQAPLAGPPRKIIPQMLITLPRTEPSIVF